jgi:hypothetical protein
MLTNKCPAGTFCSTTTIGGSTVPSGGLGSYPNKKSQADDGNACEQYKYCPEGSDVQIDIATSGYETILI